MEPVCPFPPRYQSFCGYWYGYKTSGFLMTVSKVAVSELTNVFKYLEPEFLSEHKQKIF